MDSFLLGARSQFAAILRKHNKARSWHYAIHLNHHNANSLSRLLCVELREFECFLLFIGLAKIDKRNKDKVVCNAEAWRKFIIEEELDDVVEYFDIMQVSKIPGNDDGTFHKSYRGYWLGLGCGEYYINQSNGTKPNPKSQFHFFRHPPRITRQHEVVQLKDVMRVLQQSREEYESIESVIKGDETSDDMLPVTAPSGDDKYGFDKLSFCNLKVLIEDLANGNKSAEDTIMMLSASIQEARFEEQKERMKIVNRIVAIGDGAENEEKGKSVSAHEDFLEGKEKKKKVPLLSQLNVPINKHVISTILREIVSLHARNKNSWARRPCS